MKKINLPLYSDTLFVGSSIWLLTLCILRYYRLPLWASVLLATLLAIPVAGGTFLFLSRRSERKLLRQRDIEEKDKLMLHLALSSDEKLKKLFDGLTTAECTLFLFTLQPLSADEIAQKLKSEKSSFSIWCNALTNEAQKLCTDFDIEVKEGTDVYFLLKDAARLPEKYICGERKRIPFRQKLKGFVDRKNAKRFLLSGSILLFFSLFTFFPIYYLISGSLLLAVALFIRIFG